MRRYNNALLTDASSLLRRACGAAKRGRSVAHWRRTDFRRLERALDSGKSREAITDGISRTEAIIQP
jgi:hypothetical protein